MGYQFDKSVHAQLYRIGTQVDDTTVIRLAGTSVAGTATVTPNPMIGAKLWNQVCAMVDVTATAAGSFTINLYSTINGMTYPVLRWLNGPVTAGQYPMTNLCQSPYAPQPQYIEFDETAAGGLTATVHIIAKNYKGFYPGRATAGEKTVEGRVLTFNTVAADGTRNLIANPPSGGTFGSTVGTEKFSMIDSACLFANITACSGTWTIYAIGSIAGQTVEVARTPSFSGATKVAFQNQFYGPLPRLTDIIFDTTAGGGPGVTGHIDIIYKTNRGQRYKV